MKAQYFWPFIKRSVHQLNDVPHNNNLAAPDRQWMQSDANGSHISLSQVN
jgi:hypothetical protein